MRVGNYNVLSKVRSFRTSRTVEVLYLYYLSQHIPVGN